MSNKHYDMKSMRATERELKNKYEQFPEDFLSYLRKIDDAAEQVIGLEILYKKERDAVLPKLTQDEVYVLENIGLISGRKCHTEIIRRGKEIIEN
ncbi:MAG: hypothetical protein V1870_00760 [Candidatus Aenigmatarchaeota archaeon]